jgi:hypothetical protein
MSPMTKEREKSGLADIECREASALVMSESGGDLGASKELLRLTGYRVQMCSSYIELLLHLEHATYQLVIIFEDNQPSPEWHSVIKQVASSSAGALVLVFKRPEEVTNLPGVSANQN